MKFIQDRLYHILYRTVCIPTHEFYYGVHSTDNLDDGYLGTGKKLLNKIKSYGRKSFQRTIVFTFNTRDEAAQAEAVFVTEDLLKHPLCLNLQTGGYLNVKYSAETLEKLKKNDEQRAAISLHRTGKATFVTEEQRQRQSEKVSGSKNGMFNVVRPQEWCDEQSARQKKLFDLGNHPFQKSRPEMKGRKWFHNPTTGETIFTFDSPPDGFFKGRGLSKTN